MSVKIYQDNALQDVAGFVNSKADDMLGTTDISEVGDGSITGAIGSLNNNFAMKKSGTIASGDTTITLTDDSFTENAIVDIYFWDKVLAPTSIVREGTSITITIDAQETDTRVGIFAR